CQRVVERWISKDADSTRDIVHAAVAGFWEDKALGGEELLAKLESECQSALGQAPDAAFEQILGPLAALNPQNFDDCISRILEALTRIEQLVGKPEEALGSSPGALIGPLLLAVETMTAKWGKLLTGFAIGLIEQPECRLVGAEEAIRRAVTTIEEILHRYEPLAKEFIARSTEAYSQIADLIALVKAAPAGNRKAIAAIGKVVELVRIYPRWRLQSLLLHRVTNVFVSLRGKLSDQLTELNFCRNRLVQLKETFQSEETDTLFTEELASQRTLFPANASSLHEATEAVLVGVTLEEI